MKKCWLPLLCLTVLLLAIQAGYAEALNAFGVQIDPQTRVLDFDAASVRVTDAQAVADLLDQLPAVREVRMFDSELSREDMEWLFDTYPDVFFGWTLRFAIHTVRTDATAFSTLHRSRMTDPQDRLHTTKELSILRLCTRLKALDLGHNRLNDLSFLSGLTELRVLIISPNYALKDLSPLAGLTNLEYLEAFSTDTNDVSALSNLTKLRDLNLTCSDHLKDISCLYDLPNLERFWCGNVPISRQQKQEIMARHPDCVFDWGQQPTGGSWRKHPHYDVIHEMFRGDQYIPFD